MKDYEANKIQRIIHNIDKIINRQLNIIIHTPQLQKLEASWRSLEYLINSNAEHEKSRIKIKVLNISWIELTKDMSRASEFDQSQLFLKIYNNEFGHAGGEPFSLLIGDYAISHISQNSHGTNDISTLRSIAKVAAAAFAPFITSIDASFLGLANFSGLEKQINWERIFQSHEYNQWKLLRQDEDARFIGLTLPNILIRPPYKKTQSLHSSLFFTEEIVLPTHYLWANAAYCFASVCMRAFSKTGWFTDIRGARKDAIAGRVLDLPEITFTYPVSTLAIKNPINIYITDYQEKILTDQGFIPLTVSQKNGSIVFYECSSIQTPKKYLNENAEKNSRLSSMLHYILCVARFAHYLKIIARNRIGSFGTAQQCQQYLQNWLHQYTAASTDLSDELKAKYPLREADVKVFEGLGVIGSYLCTIHLSPHYQFDQIHTFLQFNTELIRHA